MKTFRNQILKSFLSIKQNLVLVVFRESLSDLAAFIRRFIEARLRSQEDISIKKINLVFSGRIHSEKKLSQSEQRYVVLDQFPIPQWLAINSILAKEIANNLSASPKVFAFRTPSTLSKRMNSAFGLSEFLIIRLNITSWKLVKSEYTKILSYLNKESELIDYKIDEIPIGLDIYESVLRLGRVTVSLRDWQTYRVIYLALKQYCYFEPLFTSKRISAVVVSHDNYVGPGLLAHIAFRYKVPVLLANTVSFSMPTAPFQLYEKFQYFRNYAREIPTTDLHSGINWAKSELQKRIGGEIGVGMDYQSKSAFTQERIERQTAITNGAKVLILTHDFFDNPHGYGRMLFSDFYAWLQFLGELSELTDYDWYIKPHRDYSELEFTTLKKYVRKFPRVKMVKPETSYHQLREEGVDFVLTCYGSAGHELPLLGFTVINASYNPHIAFDFNVHAKSLLEYKEIIMNLPTQKLQDIDLERVYEYYYIQKKFVERDDLMGMSQIELSRINREDPSGKSGIDYLVNNAQSISEGTKRVLKQTISSKLVYSFENTLSVESQLRIELGPHNSEFFRRLG